jgi:N-acetylglutamate synthase-like GNAT family acetyltransferase
LRLYRDAIRIAGVFGLERLGDVARLRSLVVADAHLRRGLGMRLVAAAEDLPARLGVQAIFRSLCPSSAVLMVKP